MSVAGVAAGHPATVEAGVSILDAGGTAVDAAVAATFAACVAETIMTGLGGGGFGTCLDADSGRVSCFDFFVAVPGLGGGAAAPPRPVEISFGTVPLEFSIGAATVAVPGVGAGCAAMHRRFGRLPWSEVLAPAVALAAEGVPMPPTHAAALASIAPAMLPGEGALAYAPGGELLGAGQRVFHPGLAATMRGVAERGASFLYRGELAETMCRAVRDGGGTLSPTDLAAYRVRELPVCTAEFAGHVVSGRRDLAGTVDALRRLDSSLWLARDKRVVAAAEALNAPDVQPGDTTNVSAVDARGNACVITTTLGLGSGVWPRGTGIHLNSMLGEGELLRGPAVPGRRMGSMMSPLVVRDRGRGRVVLAAGAAGASRIRTALVHTLTGVLCDGLSTAEAIAAPRFHPVGPVAHVEAGLDPRDRDALERAGYRLVTWDRDAHYFGGVSAVGDAGAAGDPRRDGAGRWARPRSDGARYL